MSPPRAGALSRYRICDLTGQLAGAGATRWLAAFGADVIRVEDPVRQGTWDILRTMPPFVDERRGVDFGGGFNNHNVEKRGIALDLRTQRGRELLAEIVKRQVRSADGRYATTGVPPRTPREFASVHEWLVELGLDSEFPEAFFLRMGAERGPIDLAELGRDAEATAIFGAGREALGFLAARIPAYDFFVGAQRRGLSAGIVRSPQEALEDPHLRARGYPVQVEHPELGRSFTYPGAPYRFEKSPWRISRRAPRRGEHTDEVLRELGLGAGAIAKLRADGVV
jgi:crotonobetainyl-CoA:carnitine CoA-transferase CaiB-like acyl-CoA transferase